MNEEHIVAAWAEDCAGPGWSNQVVWYLVRLNMGSNEFCVRAVQPSKRSPEIATLHDVSATTNKAMTDAVRAWAVAKSGE